MLRMRRPVPPSPAPRASSHEQDTRYVPTVREYLLTLVIGVALTFSVLSYSVDVWRASIDTARQQSDMRAQAEGTIFSMRSMYVWGVDSATDLATPHVFPPLFDLSATNGSGAVCLRLNLMMLRLFKQIREARLQLTLLDVTDRDGTNMSSGLCRLTAYMHSDFYRQVPGPTRRAEGRVVSLIHVSASDGVCVCFMNHIGFFVSWRRMAFQSWT